MSLGVFLDEIIMHIMEYLTGYHLTNFGTLNGRMYGIFMEIMKHNYNYTNHIKIIKSYLDMLSVVAGLFINIIKEHKEIVDINANYDVTYYVYSKNAYIDSSADDERYLSNITIYTKYYNSWLSMYGGGYKPTGDNIEPMYKSAYKYSEEQRAIACDLLSKLYDIHIKYKYVMLGFRKICKEHDYNIYLSITGETYPFDIFYC